MNRVNINAETIRKAETFAANVIETVDYSDSNQYSSQKIKYDHMVSKIAEEAVKQLFESNGRTVIGPDYSIYLGKHKSWNSDLIIDGKHLAVKSQETSAALKYGLSWTFQLGSKRRDPILSQMNAWVCFVEVNTDGLYCNVYDPVKIKNLTFKEPKIQRLVGLKTVVYASDL